MLCRVAAQVTAAMPSAQHPALHNSPASHVAVGMSVRMSTPGLFMRKLPLGRAQVTGYTTPQTDFCSLVLLPLLFLSPGCGSLEPVERSWLGGLSPASSSEGTGPCHSQCCSPPCPAQAPPLRESLFQTGTAGLMLFPIQPISFPHVFGHGQMPCKDTSFSFSH